MYLGRDTLKHMNDKGIESYLLHDRATLRAEMDITPDEFNQILDNFYTKKKKAEKKKVITLTDFTKEG